MFTYHILKATSTAIGRKKYFALAVQYEFLQIEGYGLGNAEVFHILRYLYLQLLAYPEKVIYSVAAGKDNSSILGYIYPLLPEVFARKSFNPYKSMEI